MLNIIRHSGRSIRCQTGFRLYNTTLYTRSESEQTPPTKEVAKKEKKVLDSDELAKVIARTIQRMKDDGEISRLGLNKRDEMDDPEVKARNEENSRWGRATSPLFNSDERNPRFYKSVAIEEYDHNDKKGYVVRIGQEQYLRSLTTNNVVVLPNKYLTNAVVAEWELQQEFIRPNTLPISNLLVNIQDAKDNPLHEEKLKGVVLGYFDAEFICHQEDLHQRDTIKYIESHWTPIIQWFEKTYEVKLKVFEGDSIADNPNQTDAKNAFIRKYSTNKNPKYLDEMLDLLPAHKLTALQQLTDATCSVTIAIALMEGGITREQAVNAAQWPLLFQIGSFGMVMGDHDLELSEQKMKISSIALFYKLYELHDE
ncbi:ATP synthase Mitochondrial F1 complex assembly factor 2 [Acrasis kona]|uniref:ATP synthase Mitochondrial F1 complex assembly factor 2 n=1 Tax=Acrasis kona TaxID=1008807 RepID=A0AAW2ZMG5_9EUKA